MEGKTKLSNEILARAARLCGHIACNEDCPLQKEEASNCFSSRMYCLQRVRYLDRYVGYLQGKLDKAGIAYMTELDMDKIFKKDGVEVEYKRLTRKDERGFYHYNCTEKDQEDCVIYENCGECYGTSVLYRLAKLEDKIEQGTLIELPCKVGDKVYVVYKFPDCVDDPDFEYDILVERVHDIIVMEDGFDIGTECSMVGKFKRICVCITREEAEKRLKELQNG